MSIPKLSLVVIYWCKPFMTLLFRIYFVVLINSRSYFSGMFEKAQWIPFVMDITSILMHGRFLYMCCQQLGLLIIYERKSSFTKTSNSSFDLRSWIIDDADQFIRYYYPCPFLLSFPRFTSVLVIDYCSGLKCKDTSIKIIIALA